MIGSLGEIKLEPFIETIFKIPEIKDPDNDKYELKLVLGDTTPFSKYNEQK